jgi:hypothetical protein
LPSKSFPLHSKDLRSASTILFRNPYAFMTHMGSHLISIHNFCAFAVQMRSSFYAFTISIHSCLICLRIANREELSIFMDVI